METAKKAIKHPFPWVPSAGYNVVNVDRYKAPGEDMWVLSHHKTEAEAEAAAKKYAAEGIECGVWGPATP